MVEITPSGKNLQAIASAVIEAFNDQRIQLFEDADLRRDLHRLRIEERSFGFRLVSPRDQLGHGDMGTAFGLALLAATQLAEKRRIQVGAFGMGDGGPYDTPFSRALSRFEYNQKQFSREQQLALRGEDDQQPIADVFRLLGR